MQESKREIRHTFVMLDGLRGVAAAMTLLRHLDDPIVNGAFNGVYLAVDMFFALSGFVLTHSYQDRLGRTITTGQFAIARLIRFYPLYALGTTVGIAYFWWAGPPPSGHTPNIATMAAAAVVGLLFLPVSPALAFDPRQNLFPYNPSAWSLLMEYIVNVGFAFALPRLTTPRLLLLLALLYGALGILAVTTHGINFGWGYGPGGYPAAGLVRASASFVAGIAVYRFWASGRWRPRVSPWLPPLLLLLMFQPTIYGGRWRSLYDLLATTMLFPGLILLSASIEPDGKWRKIMRILGVASYPIYVIHAPVCEIVARAMPEFYGKGAPLAVRLVADGFLLVTLIGMALILDRVFDRPLREMLTTGVARLRHGRQIRDAAPPL